MRLVELSKDEVKKIYNDRMTVDFPRNELKPLSIIYSAIDKNEYECLGLSDGTDILGYTFLAKSEGDYLVDYLAINPEQRNEGLGGETLRLLKEKLSEARSVILEVEDPDFAVDEEQRQLRCRRLNFYLRNGLERTGVTSNCFGAQFIILEMVLGSRHPDDMLREIYKQHYKRMLSEKMYKENIFV